MSGNGNGKFKIKTKWIALALLPVILITMIVPTIFYGTVSGIVDKVGELFNDILDKITINGKDLVIDEEYYDQVISRLKSMGIDAESLGFGGDISYLRTFLEAEIVTNFPYFGGEGLQGTVYFERANIDGTTKELEYIAYEDFYDMINNADANVFNYFTVNMDDWTVHVGKNVAQGDFSVEKIKYKTLVEKYTMPFEFVISLALVTQNPNFALAVVDLVKDSKIVITIAESKTTITTETVTAGTGEYKVDTFDGKHTTSYSDATIRETNEEENYTTNVMLTRAKTWVLNEITTLTYEDQTDVNVQGPTRLENIYGTPSTSNGETRVYNVFNRSETITTTTRRQRWNKGKTEVIDKASNFTNLIRRNNSIISGGAIAQLAKECHDYLAENQYWYPSAANLSAGGFVADGEPVIHKFPEEGESDNTRYVDCSAFVSWVLKKVGYDDIGCVTVSGVIKYGKAREWEFINSIDEVQAGDMCIWGYSGDPESHINICVGKNDSGDLIYYDCGATSSIRAIDPITFNGSFSYAIRPNDEIASSASVSTLEQLKESIEKSLEGISGTWAVSVRNLDNNSQKFTINNSQIKSDGLVKLFIMAVAYDNVNNGKIKEDDIQAEIEKMIQTDDANSANNVIIAIGKANMIINKVSEEVTSNEDYWRKGQEVIKTYLNNNRYKNTQIEEQIKIYANSANEKNYTSVEDVTTLMQNIYRGRCVNKNYSDKMLAALKQQMFEDKIPSQITSGNVYNKTAENYNAQQDSAIVLIDNANYLLTVMSYDTTKEASIETIKEISKKVYNYFEAYGKAKNNIKLDDDRLDTIMQGDKVCYKIPPSSRIYECPLNNLIEGADMLFEILSSQEKTQDHVDLMKYFMYLLTGKSYGVTEFNFQEFLNGAFNTISGAAIGRYAMALKLIEFYEGCTPEQDGKYQVVNIGDGVRTVGRGVTLENLWRYFEKYGINIADYPVGSWMDKEIVDNVKMDFFNDKVAEVEGKVSDFNLEPWQVDALISRIYNCGNINGFPSAYSQYGDTDALYNNYMSTPITDGDGNVYPGLITRRQNEWKLFHEGIYNFGDEVIDARSVDYSSNASTTGTDAQNRIVEIASSQDTLGAGSGLCQTWVYRVYRDAGLGDDSRCCASLAAETWMISSDRNNIPLGACVYGYSNPTVYDSCGRDAGHVGIYIGNGQVASNVGGIRIESLESWIAGFGWKGWGWNGGIDASQR